MPAFVGKSSNITASNEDDEKDCILPASAVIGASSSLSIETDEHWTESDGLKQKKERLEWPDTPTKHSEFNINARLAISCSLSYCLNYFLRNPLFMLRDDISKQTAALIFGTNITLQEALTIVYCVAFGLAKFPAVHVMSSAIYFRHRLQFLSTLVVLSAALCTLPLAFSGGAPKTTLCGLFLGCFPSSMLYGGLVSYVEGRRSTELIIAVVHFSMVFSGSASRGTATAVLSLGVSDCWMPAVIACVVTPLILVVLWVLDRSPPPSPADIASRTQRRAMTGQERAAFVGNFRPGLLLLLVAYSMLTAVRFLRDLFSRDLFTAANGGVTPSSFVFAIADLPGAVLAAGVLIAFVSFEDSSHALRIMILTMAAFIAVMLLVTWLFSAGMVDGVIWQIMLGAGLYGTYSIACMPIYDRLVSASGHASATCTFLVFYNDMAGYAAAVVLIVWKTFGASNTSPQSILDQFIWASTMLCASIAVCLIASYQYFKHRLK